MNDEKRKLIEQLHIKLSDSDWQIAEKLFCAALLQEETNVIAKVLKRYCAMRDIFRAVAKEAK